MCLPTCYTERPEMHTIVSKYTSEGLFVLDSLESKVESRLFSNGLNSVTGLLRTKYTFSKLQCTAL